MTEPMNRRAQQWAEVAKVSETLHRNLSLPIVLERITQGIVTAFGFRLVVLNVRENDSLRVAAIVGPPDAVAQLSGTHIPWDTVATVMQERYRISRSYLILHDQIDWTSSPLAEHTYTPDLTDRGPGYWHRDDMLLVPLYEDDTVIGILSVDDPEDGRLPDEETIQALEVFADQAAIAIRNARIVEELQTRDREMDAFVYSISHDLKLPLTTMRGYAEALLMLASDRLNTDEIAMAQNILNSADRMTTMIDNLLMLTRAGRFALSEAVVDTNDVIEAILSRLLVAIVERDAHIEVQPDLPAVRGNADWVDQILTRLIDNALKFGGRGETGPRIRIGGRREGNMAHLWIADGGLGLTSEQIAHVFEMFARFHKEEAEGTGLGLTIARRAAERMGGRLWVESPGPNQGCTFHLMLPLG